MTDADYAAATWTATTRTLATGTPDSPTSHADDFAAAVWGYTPRTLTSVPLVRRAVFAALAGSSAVASVVAAKIFPITPDESSPRPWVVYQLVSDVSGQLLRGADGTSKARFQIAASSFLQSDCETLMNAVRGLFDGVQGPLPPVTVMDSWTTGETDSDAPDADGSDARVYRSTIDVLLVYRRPVPANQN